MMDNEALLNQVVELEAEIRGLEMEGIMEGGLLRERSAQENLSLKAGGGGAGCAGREEGRQVYHEAEQYRAARHG